MDRPPSEPAVDPDRLNGWKEIASYLGKGVRTAQRWERELGLPVHRLGREGGEIVFAFRSEIDAWSRADGASGREADAEPEGSVQALGDTALRVPARSRSRGLVAAVAAVAIGALVIAATAWMAWSPRVAGPAPQPASWRVTGETLRVFDDSGAELWSKAFPGILEGAYAEKRRAVDPITLATILDLDGDGSREVLFGLSMADLRAPGQGFLALNHDGSERFRIEPDSVVRFGTTEYRPPWLFRRLFVTRRPDGRPSLWLVFVHGMEFPTLLVEIDPDGRVRLQYWSNGYIGVVAEATWSGRPTVFVGAAHNDTLGASLAIFDREDVSGSALAIDPGYRCVDCPDGRGPTAFLLFPRRCVLRALEGIPDVTEVWADAGGRLHVAVTEWGPPGRSTNANVYYWFGPDLTLERAEVTPNVRVLHRQMEQAGRLDHAWGPGDEADLFPVRRWNGSTFVDLPPAPVTR